MTIRTYTELMDIPTFQERYEYLKLSGKVGEETFGFDRWLNQMLYRSTRWRELRHEIIVRDDGCDLAVPDRQLFSRIVIHHMNPITVEDVESDSDFVWNPNYLISTSFATHEAIHYGDSSLLVPDLTVRQAGDTCPWKGGTSYGRK